MNLTLSFNECFRASAMCQADRHRNESVNKLLFLFFERHPTSNHLAHPGPNDLIFQLFDWFSDFNQLLPPSASSQHSSWKVCMRQSQILSVTLKPSKSSKKFKVYRALYNLVSASTDFSFALVQLHWALCCFSANIPGQLLPLSSYTCYPRLSKMICQMSTWLTSRNFRGFLWGRVLDYDLPNEFISRLLT